MAKAEYGTLSVTFYSHEYLNTKGNNVIDFDGGVDDDGKPVNMSCENNGCGYLDSEITLKGKKCSGLYLLKTDNQYVQEAINGFYCESHKDDILDKYKDELKIKIQTPKILVKT